MFNILAILLSAYWCIEKNWNQDSFHIESLLSTLSLIGAFASLNFINEKLGKPIIKLKLNNSLIPQDAMNCYKKCVSLDIVNHSITKVYIRSIQIDFKENGQLISMNFLIDGITFKPFFKIALNPGERFSFYITHEQIFDSKPSFKLKMIKELKVTTDTDYVYKIRKSRVIEHLTYLKT